MTSSNSAHDAGAMRARNLRLALILASVGLTFFAGFMAKVIWLGHS